MNFNSPSELRSLENFIRRFRPVFAKAHGKARRLENGVGDDGSLESWCFAFLPEYFSRAPSLMHRWMFRTLEHFSLNRGSRLNLLAPRGNAKSTIGTLAYPLRAALEGTEPYVWIVSDTLDQAVLHLENIRRALDSSPLFKERYASALNGKIRFREGRLLLPNGVRIEAFGTGQKLRGRRHGAHRPSLIIGDDLQNEAHARSSRLRQVSRDWFFGTLLKAGNSRTNFIHLATALHRDALAMELNRTPGWKSRIFRAILRYPDRMDLWEAWENLYLGLDASCDDFHDVAHAAFHDASCDVFCDAVSTEEKAPSSENASVRLARSEIESAWARRKLSPAERASRFYLAHEREMNEGAVVLWPEEEDLLTLMKMRAESGKISFEREKQNSPLNPDLCEWEEKHFEREDFWFDKWPTDISARVMALDPSKGKHANRGDFAAYVMLALGNDGELYVEAELLRLPIEEMVEAGIRLWRSFRPDAFGVEGNQFQDLLADFFRQRFLAQRLPIPQPYLIFNSVAKDVRIRRLGQWLTSGKIHFKTHSSGTALLVEQLRQFPIGDHDDGPDALEMALRLLNRQLGDSAFDDGLGTNLFQR